jgi:hypothetical protein
VGPRPLTEPSFVRSADVRTVIILESLWTEAVETLLSNLNGRLTLLRLAQNENKEKSSE